MGSSPPRSYAQDAVSTRSRLYAAVLLVATAVALAHYVQVWSVVPAPAARTSDYAGSYAASVLWRTGRGGSIYDVGAEEQVSRAAGVPANHLFIPFENPPLAAVVASPLSLLDATTAYRVWSLLQLALLVAAVTIAARVAPWPRRAPRLSALSSTGLALAGFGTGLLLVEGQWDGLVALGLALGYAGWRRGRGFGPGFAIGATAAMAKPHLIAGVIAFMVGRRDWRGLAGAATGAAAVLGAGVLLTGPATGSFIAALLQPVNSPSAEMQGATGLFGSLFGGGLAPYAAAIAAACVAALVAGRLGAVVRKRPDLLEPGLLGAATLSLFASPHLLGHDLTLLAPALVAGLAWTLTHEEKGFNWPGSISLAVLAGWAALSVASLLDLGQSGVGLPGRLSPWVLLAGGAAMAAFVIRAARQPLPSPAVVSYA